MLNYVIRRLGQAIIVILCSTLFIFVATRATADPTTLLLPEIATAEEEAELRRELGLDRPLPVQYFRFLTGLLRGDFGTSWVHHQPAIDVVLSRLPASLELAAGAWILTLVISIPLGLSSGYLRSAGKWPWLDKAIMAFAVFGVSAPSFWLAIFVILIFSVQLGWLPTSGRGSFQQLILPVTVVAVQSVAIVTRMTRAETLEAIYSDYIRTARAKGLRERRVVFRHVLKNALIPVTTVMGISLGNMLAYQTVIETIFAWPGIGRLMYLSMLMLDYPVLVVYGMLVAVIFTLLNLTVDISYAVLDPRIARE